MPNSLELFYDLVHKLNSSLDMQVVLAQVIEEINHFLNIDATSVSLLDEQSQELVIQMTIGKETDPQTGLRLPPFAGVAGWVVRHGEPVLITNAQQDSRFYPGVDQLTRFTTRSMICVPLINQGRVIGVIQAINKNVNAFSHADLSMVIMLADVAALSIENARLYKLEQQARRQAEALRHITEPVPLSSNLSSALTQALEHLQIIISYDNAIIFTLKEGILYHIREWAGQENGVKLPAHPTMTLIAERGLNNRDMLLNKPLPTASIPLFNDLLTLKQPISIIDAQADERYRQWSDIPPTRSWLGVPLLVENQYIGEIGLTRYQVCEFSEQDISVALAFAGHVAGVILNVRLYQQTRDRADDLAILNAVSSAIGWPPVLPQTLERMLDSTLNLLGLEGGGISLPNPITGRIYWAAQRGLSAEEFSLMQGVSVQNHTWGHKVVLERQTLIVEPDGRDEPRLSDTSSVYVLTPLPAHKAMCGILFLRHANHDSLSTNYLALLEAIGHQIGMAIEMARLFESAAR